MKTVPIDDVKRRATVDAQIREKEWRAAGARAAKNIMGNKDGARTWKVR